MLAKYVILFLRVLLAVGWRIHATHRLRSSTSRSRLSCPVCSPRVPSVFTPSLTSWLRNGTRPGWVVHYETQVPATVALPTALPKVLVAIDPEHFPSLTQAKKACRGRTVVVNGVQSCCNDTVSGGDMIALQSSLVPHYRPFGKPPRPSVTKRDVVYEDHAIAVVFKPSGISAHPRLASTLEDEDREIKDDSMRKAIQFVLREPPLGTKDALWKPELVHRLDRNTSGLVLCAKTRSSLISLQRSFAQRAVGKQYRTIVCGRVDGEQGEIDSPIMGRTAKTKWQVLSRARSLRLGSGHLTELALFPLTGRTHQLRRHCAEVLGKPILGDMLYGGDDAGSGMFLSAVELSFTHPEHTAGMQPIHIQVDPPAKFHRALNSQQEAWEQMYRVGNNNEDVAIANAEVAPYTATGLRRVAAIVFMRVDDSMLHSAEVLLQVYDRGKMKGQADFPAILNKIGETMQEAAARHCREAFNIELSSEPVSLGVLEFGINAMEYFVVRDYVGEPAIGESKFYYLQWVRMSELNSSVALAARGEGDALDALKLLQRKSFVAA